MDQLSGTDEAVSMAIEKYSDMVRRICFLYLTNKEDVEDVFQEVFLKLFQHSDGFIDEQHQKAWLCRVTFNKCKDLCKSYWRKKVISLEETKLPFEDPEQSVLMDALMQLPPDHKELIYLHYYEGRSIPEIAKMTGRNQNTIYSRLKRAKARLKQKAGDI